MLIDTAGRYTTHDSDAETDRKSWLSFLSLLKHNRAKQPINGVILAISVEDVLLLPEDELTAHANAIRKRLLELHQELKIDFPVYALFTKADLIDGFREYFGNFTETRRRKVWGATFQTEDRKKNLVVAGAGRIRRADQAADRGVARPPARRAGRASPASRSSASRRSLPHCAPRVTEFLNRIFEPTRYQTNANLRGFYLSSGTQEGTPIDQVLGAMGRSLAVDDSARHLSGRGKSFFLHDLLKQRHLRRVRLGVAGPNAVRRAAVFRYGAMAAIAVASLAMLGAWGWSYASNKALIAIGRRRDRRLPRSPPRKSSAARRFPAPRRSPATTSRCIASYLSAAAHHAGRLRAYATTATPLGETFGLEPARPAARGVRDHLPQRAGADAALAPDPAARAADHRLA